MQNKWTKVISVTAGLAVVGFLAFLLDPDATGHAAPLTAMAARNSRVDLSLAQIGGGVWKSADHRGQVILVNFWATWCPPCRMETPGLVRLANEYRSKGVEIVGVAMDDDGSADTVTKFVRSYGIPYPILLPTDSLLSQIDSLPTTFLMDRQGRIAKSYVGAISEATFRKDIDNLLQEP